MGWGKSSDNDNKQQKYEETKRSDQPTVDKMNAAWEKEIASKQAAYDKAIKDSR